MQEIQELAGEVIRYLIAEGVLPQVCSYSRITVHGEGQEFARVHFPLCGEYLAGQWPQS